MLKKKKPNSERKASCAGTRLWIDGGSWGGVIESTGLSAEDGLALQGPQQFAEVAQSAFPPVNVFLRYLRKERKVCWH